MDTFTFTAASVGMASIPEGRESESSAESVGHRILGSNTTGRNEEDTEFEAAAADDEEDSGLDGSGVPADDDSGLGASPGNEVDPESSAEDNARFGAAAANDDAHTGEDSLAPSDAPTNEDEARVEDATEEVQDAEEEEAAAVEYVLVDGDEGDQVQVSWDDDGRLFWFHYNGIR